MVSIASTSRKYRGKMASGYEAKRKKQLRWKLENEIVEKMLRSEKNLLTVLDVPAGTGRFMELYEKMELDAIGVDSSEEMLKLARRKKHDYPLEVGDATKLRFKDQSHDAVVCVRFLDLIDEDAMRKVVAELCRVARRSIILTIRLGAKYVPKSNTAEHDERKFRVLVRRLGFVMAEEQPIFNAGWQVLKLRRKG